MNGRRTETPHYTREQVVGHLDDALTILAELEIPDDLRPVAYRKAVELLAAKNITIEQVAPSGLLVPPGGGGH